MAEFQEYYRLHDARHTAATVLIILEVSSRVVMDQMGWSSPQMIERYGHVTDRMRRSLADRIDGFLIGLIEPEKGDPEPEPDEAEETEEDPN